MAIEDITRKDLEQLFENQTELISKGFDNVDKRFDNVDDQIGELRARMSRIEKQSNEDIGAAYKAIENLEKRMCVLEKAQV